MKDLKLERILKNIQLNSIEYMGQKWSIGDTFYHKHNEEDIEDTIDSISIVGYDSNIYKTELRLEGEIYACNIENCYKLIK